MKRLLLSLYIVCTSITVHAGFGIWASAVYLQANGSSSFYNTLQVAGPLAIGVTQFSGNLGVFAANSGTFRLLGAEVNTFKTGGAEVCGGNIFYAIYPQSARPANPVFASIHLGVYCACSGKIFAGCGGGGCTNNGTDQKLQNVSKSIDLTAYAIGSYTLELYYTANGGTGTNNCNELFTDNAAGANYKANFIITSALPIVFTFLNGVSTETQNILKWTVQNDLDVEKYEVQKSENGFGFNAINSTISKRSPGSSSYLFTDAAPIFGTNYYRIKVFYDNGTITLSRVFRIYFGKVGNTIFVYSNPSGTELTVRLAAVNKGNYKMSVYNSIGQQIATTKFLHDGNDKTVQLTMPVTLTKGIYRLFLIDKAYFFKQSFLAR